MTAASEDVAGIEALAMRCEEATGESLEMDWQIADAIGVAKRDTISRVAHGWQPAPYTASLDAAMSLEPEGWKLRQMAFNAPCADDRKWHLNLFGGKLGEDTFVGRGATPALALCAAALRAHLQARASTSDQGEK